MQLVEVAESEGFEPSIRLLTLYSLSRGAPSAARATLRVTSTNYCLAAASKDTGCATRRQMKSSALRAATCGPVRHLGIFAALVNAVAPKAYEVVMNTAFELFPDSAAAKGDRKALKDESPSQEQIAFAALMRGVHW